MKHLYILTSLLVIFSFSGHMLAQEPLTDRIVIEFMEPGDPDAEARNYHLLPWPEEAKAPAYKAAEIWASYLEITVPIRVKFGWCDNITPNAMGGPMYSYPYTEGIYYPLPLINQLLGYDRNENVVDIICVFRSDVNWYFGLEEKQQWEPDPLNPGALCSKNSIIPTMLHEICHGLGMSGSMKVEDGRGSWGGTMKHARIYDTFLCDGQGRHLTDINFYSNNSLKLAEALTSDEVYWSGTYATAANEGVPVKMNASKKWTASSICHIATEYGRTINDLMSNGMGGVTSTNGLNTYYTFSPGPIVLGILQDIGWTLKSTPTANEKIETTTPVHLYTCINQVVIEGIEDDIRVIIFDISGRAVYSGFGPNRITLPKGIYIAQIDNQSFKINLRY